MSIFSQNWKERKLGGQATSSSSRCQHPHHVEAGSRRSPKSPFLRKAGQCSFPPASRSAEPDGSDEGTSFGLAAEGGVLPPFPAGTRGSALDLFGKEGKGERRKTQFGLLKIELR